MKILEISILHSTNELFNFTDIKVDDALVEYSIEKEEDLFLNEWHNQKLLIYANGKSI